MIHPTDIEIRAAARSDFTEYYGVEPPSSVVAYAAFDGDEIIGIGGVALEKDAGVVFLDTKVDLKYHKRELIRATRRVLAVMKKLRRPVLAYRDPDNPKAERLLRHWGFEAATTVGDLEVWRWRNS